VQGDLSTRGKTIATILERTAWLYRNDFAAPGEHHHFTTEAEASQAPLGTPAAQLATTPAHPNMASQLGSATHLPAPKPKYRPVPPSVAFSAWKMEQGISADVFEVTPTSVALDRSLQGSLHGSMTPSALLSTVPEGASLTSTLSSTQQPLTLNVTITPSPGETLTQSAMLKALDKPEFIKAQVAEIDTLHAAGVFSYHPIHTLPPKARLLNAIWIYRRKRTPSGVFCKCKARLCTAGSQQQYGIDYWNTYTPVMSWSSVRLLLTLSHIHKWHSTQIDFTQAFTQPPIKEDVYMHIPQGCHVVNGSLQQHTDPRYRNTSHYIKLEKSLYGINVDVCLLFSPDPSVIPAVLTALQREYHIGEEGSVQDFLGVNLSQNTEGHLTFQQPALIQSILQDLGLQTCHPKPTPAVAVLHPDHGGFDRTEAWDY